MSEWHARAREMADDGMATVEIAQHFGVTYSAVYKALHWERYREKVRADNARRHQIKLAWQREKDRSYEGRGECVNPVCINLRGIGKHRRGEGYCLDCIYTIADVRRTLAEGMWADGWPQSDMAAAFGVNTNYFSVRRIHDGWDLPYRYRNTKRQREAIAA